MKLILKLRWIMGVAFVGLLLTLVLSTLNESLRVSSIGEKSFSDNSINQKQYYSELFVS